MRWNLIDNAPKSLDTFNELANSLADDANFATTIQNQLALKSPYNKCRLTASTKTTDNNFSHKFSNTQIDY